MVDAAKALLPFWGYENAQVEPITIGLINETWCIKTSDSARFALQRLNKIFDPVVHEDIHAVTAHLIANGVPSPSLVPTADGQLWVEHD
ncbi:MAG: hypothetical protein AAFN74_20275, partial [Myxococcota bacterium]